jgi:4-hydroxymandelate oxidase
VKGVAHPEDARLAVYEGMAGIYVSNHGGRQLDIAPATIETLPGIVDAVEGRIPVIVDGGIRRGTDVIVALAMGADAVGIGRPVLWGLAARGEAGAREVLEAFRAEIKNTMALCGCDKLDAITREVVRERLF